MSRLQSGRGTGSPIADVSLPDGRPFIWAPDASQVLLKIGDEQHPCIRTGEVWEAPFELSTGSLYQFVVDDRTVPDPRARSQPQGVHGPSEWIDNVRASTRGKLAPHRTNSLDRALIYEIHIGTFSAEGTFAGAQKHLDHLVTLGVTHVELMPIAAFDGRVGWGYDGVDLFAPHPEYGTTSDLAELVDACHRLGLNVLLDVVFNHLGPSGNYLSASGPYFTDRYRTPWGDAVNLDAAGSDGVRRFFIDAASYWLEDLDFDGLRLDAVHALFDISAIPFLEQLATEVRYLGERTGRPRLLIAESDLSDPSILKPPPMGPGLDGMWSDDLHHCLHVELTGERSGYYSDVGPDDLAMALTDALTHQGRYSSNRGRTIGRPVDGVLSDSFVVSLQNHDQIGNRARGERLHHVVGPDRTAAAAVLTLLSPFAVLVFQGEEWMASSPFPYFTDHAGELGEAVRKGRMEEFAAFGWRPEEIADPQGPATFDSAKLDWNELDSGAHAAALDWYRDLIHLRSDEGLAPTSLPSNHRVDISDGLVSVNRGPLSIVANLASGPRRFCGDAPGDVVIERGDRSRRSDGLEMEPGAVFVTKRS